MALALEEVEPGALRILHRAPASPGVQRDAGALGLGEHQPGARRGNRRARRVELRHELGLDRAQADSGSFLKRLLDLRDQRRIYSAGKPWLVRGARRGAHRPALGALAVDLREVVQQIGLPL